MDTSGSTGQPAPNWKIAISICVAMLLLFSILSYSASRKKNATYDEPLHALGGVLHRVAGEYRLDAEDPPFFGWWASLPIDVRAMKFDFDHELWRMYALGDQNAQWGFTILTLYLHPSFNDGHFIIQRSRMMFTLVGVMMGALIAWYGWRLAGAWAAIVATAFFALDPNFLAHSSLVKNDVMFAFTFLMTAAAMWRFGRNGSILALLGMAAGAALAINVKFSAVLLAPIIVVALTIRALLPHPWTIAGMTLRTRWQRLLVVPAACAIIGFVSYVAIWACYGWRFAPAGDRKTQFNMAAVTGLVRENRVRHRVGPASTYSKEEPEREQVGTAVDILMAAERNQLLPQAWIYGFIYTYATTISRTSWLMGEWSNNGFRAYFPLTMLFKTPTATLVTAPLAIGAMGLALILRRREQSALRDVPQGAQTTPLSENTEAATSPAATPTRRSILDAEQCWSLLCFIIPPGIYFVSAVMSNMNIGLRHILPVYPFVFIAIGVGFAWLIERWRFVGLPAAGVLLLGLMLETLIAYPNYISFFNGPTRSWRDPIRLLSDSNLDWGQDLMALGKWQASHRDKPLYLNYFGVVNPEFYGVQAQHMPGGWPLYPENATKLPPAEVACYVAISATNLQGTYYQPDRQQLYAGLRSARPLTILNETIYIFELGPGVTPQSSR